MKCQNNRDNYVMNYVGRHHLLQQKVLYYRSLHHVDERDESVFKLVQSLSVKDLANLQNRFRRIRLRLDFRFRFRLAEDLNPFHLDGRIPSHEGLELVVNAHKVGVDGQDPKISGPKRHKQLFVLFKKFKSI